MIVRVDGTPDECEALLETLRLTLDVHRRSRPIPLLGRRGRVRVYAIVFDVRVPDPLSPTPARPWPSRRRTGRAWSEHTPPGGQRTPR